MELAGLGVFSLLLQGIKLMIKALLVLSEKLDDTWSEELDTAPAVPPRECRACVRDWATSSRRAPLGCAVQTGQRVPPHGRAPCSDMGSGFRLRAPACSRRGPGRSASRRAGLPGGIT